jgi:hypothetical protein
MAQQKVIGMGGSVIYSGNTYNVKRWELNVEAVQQETTDSASGGFGYNTHCYSRAVGRWEQDKDTGVKIPAMGLSAAFTLTGGSEGTTCTGTGLIKSANITTDVRGVISYVVEFTTQGTFSFSSM